MPGAALPWPAAADDAQKSAGFSVSASSEIEQTNAGDFYAEFDLGFCPVGERGTAQLELYNPTEFDIPIRSFSTSCNCIEAQASGEAIPANSSVKTT